MEKVYEQNHQQLSDFGIKFWDALSTHRTSTFSRLIAKKLPSQSITVNHPNGKEACLRRGVKDPGWQGERWRGRKHLGDPWFGELGRWNVWKMWELQPLCWIKTCCLVVSQVKSSGLLLVLCCFYAVSSSFFLIFAAGTPIIVIYMFFSNDIAWHVFSWKNEFGWIFFSGFPTSNVEYNQNPVQPFLVWV